MGKKKALIVIAHKLLIGVYSVLQHREGYKDLGSGYLSQLKGQHLVSYHKKRLEKLGYKVDLAAVA